MGQFLHKYNTDNVHSRAVIVGLVNLLNTVVQYDNVLGDNNVDRVTVPFFYSMTGDERFLQDFFLEWSDCVHPKHADGNYDVIPRGIATLTSNTINTSAMTHRFVRGSYAKEIDGQLQTYNAFLNSIPLSMQFDIVIESDTNLDAFKIQQSIIETFYKTQVYSVSYKGFRVPCQVGFPEDYGLEKTFEFTYSTETKIELKFTLAVETYLPVIDPTTERNNWNRITTGNGPGLNIQESARETSVIFEYTSPSANGTYLSGSSLPILWTNGGAILRVNIYYRFKGEEDWIMIARALENTGSFDWKIPFFSNTQTLVNQDPIRSYVTDTSGKRSKIRAIINASGEAERIIVLDGGYGYSNEAMINVSPLIQPPPDTPTFGAPEISANVSNGEVIGFTIHDPGFGFAPTPVNYIELKIENEVNADQFQICQLVTTFTGDTDPLGANPTKITNLSPSVAELVSLGVNFDSSVQGPGVANGTTIVSHDAINNWVVLDQNCVLLVNDGEYKLDPQTAFFEIQ
jgi:hypothetical protein